MSATGGVGGLNDAPPPGARRMPRGAGLEVTGTRGTGIPRRWEQAMRHWLAVVVVMAALLFCG
jgi:hypothetical protein